MSLQRRHARGVGPGREKLHDVTLLAQPRQQLVDQRVRQRRIGEEHRFVPIGRDEPANASDIVDGDDTPATPPSSSIHLPTSSALCSASPNT